MTDAGLSAGVFTDAQGRPHFSTRYGLSARDNGRPAGFENDINKDALDALFPRRDEAHVAVLRDEVAQETRHMTRRHSRDDDEAHEIKDQDEVRDLLGDPMSDDD